MYADQYAHQRANRDELARIATELGGITLDEALRILLFREQTRADFAHLMADPADWADYLREGETLAEVDIEVTG